MFKKIFFQQISFKLSILLIIAISSLIGGILIKQAYLSFLEPTVPPNAVGSEKGYIGVNNASGDMDTTLFAGQQKIYDEITNLYFGPGAWQACQLSSGVTSALCSAPKMLITGGCGDNKAGHPVFVGWECPAGVDAYAWCCE